MLKKLFSILALLCGSVAMAQSLLPITPLPSEMTQQAGEFTFPLQAKVSTSGLSAAMQQEVERFAAKWHTTTGGTLSPASSGAQLSIADDASLSDEAYRLQIDGTGVRIAAHTPRALFYALETLQCLMPSQLRAGVPQSVSENLTLPFVKINDQPRFAYRGFMLDVSRHFFKVNEIKKILRLMAAYKLNAFHWHLSDDQGWRIEIKKYPRLTSVGAIANNCYANSMEYGPYWTNAQYGPFFYTQDQIREVLRYADSLHIDVIPEIDMPGHFTAAMVSYPEFSCRPDASREVWTHGGISNDVLNVADPKAVQFAKDILDEVIDLFPGRPIHIGGDECPVAWWQSNSLAQQLYQQEGLSNYRELQSRFIQEMGEYIQSKQKGNALRVWNEAITADGVDMSAIKAVHPTVYCWFPVRPAVQKAVQNGLNCIVTPWGPYYINRKQSTDNIPPSSPGDGSDNLAATYNFVPVPDNFTPEEKARVVGVQGTFWTEHVSDTTYLEYLALPRLFAIAEAGWTPQNKKNYDQFTKRLAADTAFWNTLSFNYYRKPLQAQAQQTMVLPEVSSAQHQYLYTISSLANDNNRKGRCMELLAPNSPLIGQFAGKGAKAGVIWTAPKAAPNSKQEKYQQWYLEEDPAHPNHFALVCAASPRGSIKGTPTQQTVSGRWNYDAEVKHYDFILGEKTYGQNGRTLFFSVRSQQVNGYMNASLGGQGMAVNVYGNPLDGNGGVWAFQPLFDDPNQPVYDAEKLLAYAKSYTGEVKVGHFDSRALTAVREALAAWKAAHGAARTEAVEALAQAVTHCYETLGALQEGVTYRFSVHRAGEPTAYLSDGGFAKGLIHTDVAEEPNAQWTVATAETLERGVQKITLSNAKSNRGNFVKEAMEEYIGSPVTLRSGNSDLVVVFDLHSGAYRIKLQGDALYPIANTSAKRPGIVAAGSWLAGKPIAPNPLQGCLWMPEVVETTTGIENVAQAPSATAIYDLSGRRVHQLQKGIYVVNGKKIMK